MKNLIKIGNKFIGKGKPVYIIAEVGSNFDGNFKRLKRLAALAKKIGADAFKIQNFMADRIVSESGFRNLRISFQKNWKSSVNETYKKAEFPRKWLPEIIDYCKTINLDFLSSPYDIEAVNLLEKNNVCAYKIGSGEIDNFDFLTYVAKIKKPIILSCGASTIDEISQAVKIIRRFGNNQIVLLQCTTNYPAPVEDANLLAMLTLGTRLKVDVGYSDHTIGVDGGGDDPLGGLTVPLGAVALGAVVIEKHFTDDRKRNGPDHPFAMDTESFGKMVQSIRAMEMALGDGVKKVMPSEKETVIIQRRGIYASITIKKGEAITKDKIDFLRPAIGLRPTEFSRILGLKTKKAIGAGEPIFLKDIQC